MVLKQRSVAMINLTGLKELYEPIHFSLKKNRDYKIVITSIGKDYMHEATSNYSKSKNIFCSNIKMEREKA